jgi:protein DGCR14
MDSTVTTARQHPSQVTTARQHPSQVYLKRPPAQEVLDEDSYIEGVSDIIERDFFPDLKKLKTQNEFLDAVNTGDLAKAKSLGERLQRMATGRAESVAGSSTPLVSRLETPIVTGFTPVAPTDTPVSTISERIEGKSRTGPSINVNMSLDSFQSTYTSEDNASFISIMEKANKERKEKYRWFFEKETGRMLLEGGDNSNTSTSLAIENGFVKPIETWKYKV